MSAPRLDPVVDPPSLRNAFHAVVRSFGLLQPRPTPCGQPLSLTHAHALMELLHRPGCVQGRLGEALGLSKSAVSRMVAGLERRGWIVRWRDAEDGRVVRLKLTREGRRLAKRLDAASIDHFASLLERIPAAERPRVLAALEVLTRALVSPAAADRDEPRGR